MDWPDISGTGKYNPPLGCKYSRIIYISVSIYVSVFSIRIYVAFYQGSCAYQDMSASLSGYMCHCLGTRSLWVFG